jgi:hypothetical protein
MRTSRLAGPPASSCSALSFRARRPGKAGRAGSLRSGRSSASFLISALTNGEPACPVTTIFVDYDVPEQWSKFGEINALWYKDRDAARTQVDQYLASKEG